MRNVDVVIIGGGMAGCMAAKEAAAQGLRAAIVERRGALGWELTATGTTYLGNGQWGDALPMPTGALKKRLMMEQLDLGNVPLMFSHAAAVAVAGEAVTGVLLGNAYGTQYLSARAVIDAEGQAAALLGAAAGTYTAEVVYHMEISQLGYYYHTAYDVTPALGLVDDAIQLHPLIKDHTATISFSFRTEVPDTANASARINMQAKQKASLLMQWLRENHEAFAEAQLTALAPEARVIDAPRHAPPAYRNLYQLTGSLPKACGTADLEALSASVRRGMAQVAEALAAEVPRPERFLSGKTVIPCAQCGFTPFDDRNMELPLEAVRFDPALIARRVRTDALVAGAGTTGVMAMRALVEAGADFALLETNSEIGGTNTVGRVMGYWNGHKGGINPSVDAAVAKVALAISGQDTWRSREATILYLHGLLAGREASCYFGAILCGAIRDGARINGAYAATEQGLVAFDARITLDTTGDAAIAMLAGLPYAFGDLSDGMTQSYSHWGREVWTARDFKDVRTTTDLDMIYQDKYSELLRGTYLGHAQNSNWDFSEMPTARESRRIAGDYRLTLKDIIQQRAFDDTVCVSNTPFDAHGLGSNPLSGMQVIICREPLLARIPYRCYLPKGVDGLLVGGKAFSGTRDAVCVCRMNADLRNAGYMLGLAAEMALKAGCEARDIDMAKLQERLRACDILPEWTWQPLPAPDYTLPEDRINMARILAAGALPQEAADALAKADAHKRDIVLAWYGDTGALGRVAQALADGAAQGGMVAKENEPYICQCLTVLGKSGDGRWTDALITAASHARAAGAAQSDPNMYYQSRIDHWRVPNYAALLALAKASERLADARLAEPLAALLADAHIAGFISPRRHEMPRLYFCAYLELMLARAAARCGAKAGYLRLADYLADARYQLSQMAYDALRQFTGADHGLCPDAWRDWLAAQEGFAALPLAEDVAYADDFPLACE